ncbi:glycine cleavage system protein GcvH [Candidatus Omnitrophota bacterium]
MSAPNDLLYTKAHQWVKIDRDQAVVGITFYGQMQLGQVVFIDLPKLNAVIAAAATLAVIESSKAAAEVPSPLSGKVVKVNQQLVDDPELINRSPYDEGWLCVLAIDDPGQTEGLLDAHSYQALLERI